MKERDFLSWESLVSMKILATFEIDRYCMSSSSLRWIEFVIKHQKYSKKSMLRAQILED